MLTLLKRFIGFIGQFTIENEAREPKARFRGTLLTTLGASLLGSKGVIRASEGTITAGQNFQCRLIL